jgi:hypothetical protein
VIGFSWTWLQAPDWAWNDDVKLMLAAVIAMERMGTNEMGKMKPSCT